MMQDALFSDFEALGARVDVRVTERLSGKEIAKFVSQNGGVEWGYKAPISPSRTKELLVPIKSKMQSKLKKMKPRKAAGVQL